MTTISTKVSQVLARYVVDGALKLAFFCCLNLMMHLYPKLEKIARKNHHIEHIIEKNRLKRSTFTTYRG